MIGSVFSVSWCGYGLVFDCCVVNIEKEIVVDFECFVYDVCYFGEDFVGWFVIFGR